MDLDRISAQERRTRERARRLILDYVHRPGRLRTGLRRLTGMAFLLPVAFIFLAAMRQAEWIHAPGPISHAHSLFGAECRCCHGPGPGVPDVACRACHQGAPHQMSVPLESTCVSCHRTTGGARSQCVRCHRFHHDQESFEGPAAVVTGGATPARFSGGAP